MTPIVNDMTNVKFIITFPFNVMTTFMIIFIYCVVYFLVTLVMFMHGIGHVFHDRDVIEYIFIFHLSAATGSGSHVSTRIKSNRIARCAP